MKRSKISYCDFSSGDFNFATGGTPISSGCRECYARRIYERFGRDFSKVTAHPDKLERLRTKRFPQDGNVRGPHSKPICFVCDTGDLFHEKVPDEFIFLALDLMAIRDDVTWIVLTKRAQRMFSVVYGWNHEACGPLPAHIWLGVTAEGEVHYHERWEWLNKLSAETKWVSVEPMLGKMDMAFGVQLAHGMDLPDWIVCGAESGPNRRPFDPAWALNLKRQCDEAGIAFFFKQGSGLYPGTDPTLESREWQAWPR